MATKRPVTFSHPEKRYFPSGFTKGDMLRYYVGIAKLMLPHLRDRPVTLIRFPEGVKGESFYEKNAPAHAPDWIETFPVPRRKHEGVINYILVNNAETLAWCANLGAIEFHPFLHRVPEIDRPTHVAFDLDPGEGSNILSCIEVAFLLKELFEKLGLEAFPKVSGSKGLQLYVPLNTTVTYAVTTPFAKTIAEHMAQAHPKLIVSEMPKVLRKGKVMIDWSQNVQSKTTVCVYSMRGKKDEPFISVPVEWGELRAAARAKDPDRLFFTPAETLKRVAKIGDLFAPVLKLKQKLPKGFMKLSGSSQKGRADPSAVTERMADEPDEPRSRNSLARYAAKRDFTKTAEPTPEMAPAGDGKIRRFVIQKHAASHLHFDFRLEMGGTLKSWAIPKGLPYEMGVRRSAFEVEDHPVDYIDFEGTIPQGQYGGGTVMVWDQGTYELLGGSLQKGDLKLRLHGKKLKGDWHIFRIRSDESKPVWLVIKSGQAMKPLSARQEDSSVITRRSMARIAADNDRQWGSNRSQDKATAKTSRRPAKTPARAAPRHHAHRRRQAA
jgi:bifunctional non-homologous end joining protein LigD